MSQFPKLNKTTTEKSAKTIDDAILLALNELGVTKDDVEVKVLDEGKKGFLGIGAKDAVVRVSIKESVINAKARAQRAEKKAQKAEVKTEAPAAPKKPVNLPPEKRSQKKAEEKKAEAPKKPVEMTAEKKEEAKKVFATPEVRHPKKADKPVKKAEPKPIKAEEKKPAAPRKPKKISDTPSDQIAAKFLTDIFAAMQLDIKVSASMESEDSLLVNLDGENMGIVIGKRGDTLDSLQYLTSLVVNQQSEDYIKVTIDTENYREKRTEALLALSSRLAEKVAKTGRKFTLEPMNPYERRVIHANLQDHEAVTTFSVGTEPYRKVVIAPKDRKPYKKGGYRKNNRNTAPAKEAEEVSAEKKGSYTTTYKADFKPQQHKAEFENFEAYLEAHKDD